MSNFISTAQENLVGTNKAEELEGRSSEENGSLKPREFFWDNIVLFVVSTIIGLAAIDVITEFIRGGGVACFPPLGASVDEAQAAYINNFCAGFLPVGAYIPAFMVVHAVLITVPHYLWLNHYGGNFDFFFQQAASLQRSRDDKTGEYVLENLIIAQRLESTFTTYSRNSIYHLYIVKLVVQFIWSLVGVGFALGFFLSEFESRFLCPPNFNSTVIESWPLNEPVWCVFETLSLLRVLWIADVLLLLLVTFGLFWAIIWCFTTHATELGSKEVARFAFESGLAPRYYVPKLPVSSCLHTCFTSVPYISCSGPDVIKTDLDFLVMRLFLSDSGLGHIFKEVQIEKELKNLLDDDQRRLSFHGNKHKDRKADDASYIRERDYRDRALDEQDLKWSFPKTKNKVGIYRDFVTLPQDQRLVVTNAMRGAVLGLGARAPSNANAINISFGDSGYATALARVFTWVAHLNFSASYNNPEEIVSVNHFYTNIVSLVFAEDILSSTSKDLNKFIGRLRDIWVPPNAQQFLDTGYIVIGPIPREKDFHLTSLDTFLEKIAGCMLKDALLVSIRPLRIAGKNVADAFVRYEPSKYRFGELSQDSPDVATGRPRLPQWQARKSLQESLKTQSGGGGGGAGSSSSQSQEQSSGAAVSQPLLGQSSDTKGKSPPSSPSQVHVGVTTGDQSSTSQTVKQFRHRIEVTCGGSECEMEFSLYYYKDDPHIRRPKMYDPPAPVAAKVEVAPVVVVPSGEGKAKNVNVAGKPVNTEGAN